MQSLGARRLLGGSRVKVFYSMKPAGQIHYIAVAAILRIMYIM